jgi:glucose/mannose-6-phosphate isomerase
MPILNDRDAIVRIDRLNMKELLETFGQQCIAARQIKIPLPSKTDYSSLCIVGMGGSAIAGDFIRVLMRSECRVPCIVHRDYGLPSFIGEGSLVVALSYSGNTEETLSACREAVYRKADLWTLSSGGSLETFAKKEGAPHVRIPSGNPPRCSVGWLFFPLFSLFQRLGYIDAFCDTEFDDFVKAKIRECAPDVIEKNPAKILARDCFNRNILIYSGRLLAPAALRWKTQIAENSKAFAGCNEFPEMNHNEIMAWRYPEFLVVNSSALFLYDPSDHPRVSLRMELTETILKKKGVLVRRIGPFSGDLRTRLFLAVVLGDWFSFYLALLNDVDPTEISEITFLKEELSKKE